MWMVVRAFSVEVLCDNWKSMEIDHCKSIFWWPYDAIFCGSSEWFWSFLKNLCHISKLIFDCCYETHRFLWAIFVAISISSCFLRAGLKPHFPHYHFLFCEIFIMCRKEFIYWSQKWEENLLKNLESFKKDCILIQIFIILHLRKVDTLLLWYLIVELGIQELFSLSFRM